jgi:hypothetical protein
MQGVSVPENAGKTLALRLDVQHARVGRGIDLVDGVLNLEHPAPASRDQTWAHRGACRECAAHRVPRAGVPVNPQDRTPFRAVVVVE